MPRKPKAPKVRVVEHITIPASELMDNPLNPRGPTQRGLRMLNASLDHVGISRSLVAYRSKEHGGKLVLIDGHKRRKELGDTPVVVEVLDLTDEEAGYFMLVADPMATMAEDDPASVQTLLESLDGVSPVEEEFFKEWCPDADLTVLAEAAAPGGAEVGASEPDGPDPTGTTHEREFVQFSVTCTPEQRDVIAKAIRNVRAEADGMTPAVALVHMCERY